MTLRKKTLLIIGATLVGLVVILYATSRSILESGLAALERQSTLRDVERALSALSDDLAAMDSLAYDWAAWDDTYTFIEDLNEDYIRVNFTEGTFTGLKVNFVLYMNVEGELVFGEGFDLEQKAAVPLPPNLGQYLAQNRDAIRVKNVGDHVAGILPLPENPLLIAARPILPSDEMGPVRGTLVMTRYLDAAEVADWAAKTQLSLTLYPFNDPHMPADFRQARALLPDAQARFAQPLNDSRIAGYALLTDIAGQPMLILRVDVPREVWSQGRMSISYFIAALIVAGLVFGLVTLFLLERLVLFRLARLSDEVGRIGAQSSFAARVSVHGHDELASLARGINRMLAALQQAQGALQAAKDELEYRVEERTAELARANQVLKGEIVERVRAEVAEHEQRTLAESLRDIAAALTSTLDLDEVMQGILINVGRVVPHDAANIMLVEDGISRIVCCWGYAARTSEEALRALRFVVADTPTQRRMLATGQPFVVSHTESHPDWVYLPESGWVRSYVGVPIVAEDQVIGFINLDSATPGFFTLQHAERLRAFADQAAIAIENARLYRQAKNVAAMEERNRLAHELHDAVSQVLFSANMIAEVLPVLWERDPQAGRRSLADLRRLTRGAQAEMRALLWELRPDALYEADLTELLRRLVEAVTGRTGIDIELCIALERTLPARVRVTLYRIAQEALNNVARHARADRVTVNLHDRDGTVVLGVSDNGRGFSPDLIPPGHLGMSIMRERAADIGATLVVNSAVGKGTSVEVVWKGTT